MYFCLPKGVYFTLPQPMHFYLPRRVQKSLSFTICQCQDKNVQFWMSIGVYFYAVNRRIVLRTHQAAGLSSWIKFSPFLNHGSSQ